MHTASVMLACVLAGVSGAAQAADYGSTFRLAGPRLPPLRTGTTLDGQNSLPGQWGPQRPEDTGFSTFVRARTLDSVEIDPLTGALIHTYSPWYSAPSVHVYLGDPLSLGESVRRFYQSPLAYGRSYVDLISLSTYLGGDATRLDGQAASTWNRGFTLDPYSSFTFAGQFSLSIDGAELPLSTVGTAELVEDHSSIALSFRDAAGRVSGHISAVIGGAGAPLQGGIFSYDISPDGHMSLTITNPGAGQLYGTLFADTQANVVAAIPEPGAWALLLLGVVGVAAGRAHARNTPTRSPIRSP